MKNKKRGQIATILTLIMAVIFLFVVITINIGNIAQEKTMVSNAADGAALLLASMLGSLANALRIKFELYHGRQENCDVDWNLLLSIIAVVGSLILVIASLGAATPLLVMAAINLGVSVALFGVGMYNALVTEPGIFKQIELKFQNMTLEQRVKEKALQYALFAVVNDPNKLCVDGKCGDPKEHGGCIDPDDLDMDGQIEGDCIHCFSKWYNDRLKALPRLGEIVQALYEKVFSHELVDEKAPHIYVWEDPQTWEAKENEYGFWIDTDGDNQPDPEQGSLRLAVGSNDEHDPAGVVYAHDIYFTDWLEQRFPPLVKRLYDYGYGFPEGRDETATNISKLWAGIKDLQKELNKLYGATFESRLESFDEWILLFYDGTDKEDWCSRMQGWIDTVDSWIQTLEMRTNQINNDLDQCWARGPWECGYGGGHCCECHWVSCNCDENGCDSCPVCDSWCGCGPGAGGGKFCPSSSPCGKPTYTPVTPTGGPINCCNGAYNLHYQLCDAEEHCTGSDSDCGASKCCDTYHKCGVDHALNHITREHAIEYLTQFKNDAQVIKDAFEKAYQEAQIAKEDPRFYEVLYEWDDKVAKGQIGEQKVHHIAYVKLSDDLKPENGFKVPYIHNYRQWFPLTKECIEQLPYIKNAKEWLEWYVNCYLLIPKKCVKMEAEKGSFDITVARYDQDVGGGQSPLRNLWIFKTRRNPVQTEQVQSGYTDPAALPSTYAEKAKFVLENGVVSQTQGHYGPGWTYTKDEIKAWGTKAAQRNKDIYIKRLK